MKQTPFPSLFLALVFLLLVACASENMTAPIADATSDNPAPTSNAAADDSITRPVGWSEESHSNDVDPNYDVVFPQDKVNQMTITIDPTSWAAMQADMTELLGEPGTRGGPGGFGGAGENPGQPPEGFDPDNLPAPPEGNFPSGGFPGGGAGMPGGGDFTSENPMWVAATITFEGQTWTNVGVRYKGNSSLQEAWNSESLKLPLKLDFDEFEDEVPAIDNQRFYGFKQLSLANGFADNTLMREVTAYDLLAEAGLTAAATAYYEVILDYGEGPVNLGLYLMIEVIDDTVVERTFGDDSGNIYEADGSGVSLAEGTFDQISDSFQKENNEDEADWSDIEALYNVLHAEERTTNPDPWRADLEAIFDVDSFLEWLALSAVIQNWDTYGAMTHNFYLYHNPETDQLTWISWDHNMVLSGGARVGGGGDRGGRGSGPNQTVTLDKAEVNENWPLIRYLLDDEVYYQQYLDYLTEVNGLFDPDELAAQYQVWAEMLAPYAAAAGNETTFTTAVQQLTDLTYARSEAVTEFLATQ